MVDWDWDQSIGPIARIFLLIIIKFFHFLRGHQELFVNTSYAIFGKRMRLW